MLVLTRKAGESLRIGEDILVTIVSVSSYRCRIAVAAPSAVHILRTELLDETREGAADAEADGPPAGH